MVVGDHREGLFYSLCGEEAEDQGGLQELAAVYSLQGNANVIGKTRVLPLSPHPRATGISLIQDLIQLSMGTQSLSPMGLQRSWLSMKVGVIMEAFR